jgi:hypothetical protein
MSLRIGADEIGSDYAAIGDDKAGGHGPFREFNAWMSAGEGYERAADLRAGGVSVGVQDTRMGVSGFAGAQQLAAMTVKGRAPFDEFSNALGAFFDKHFGCWAMDEAVARGYRVFEMERDVFLALGGYGDTALGIVGVGFAERLLSDNQDIAVVGEFDGRAEAGYARAND